MNYSVMKIRSHYEERETTATEELKKLDAKVKRPIKIFSYIFGSVGAIIMGSGMSLIMTDISQILKIQDPMILGIIIGVVGMAIAAVNYPIYKAVMKRRRKKFAPQIIELADKISDEEEK